MVGFIALFRASLVDNHPATRKSSKGVLLHGVYYICEYRVVGR